MCITAAATTGNFHGLVYAEKTIAVLKRTVPGAMPGIFFLSGETALDEDNEETATVNLNAM